LVTIARCSRGRHLGFLRFAKADAPFVDGACASSEVR